MDTNNSFVINVVLRKLVQGNQNKGLFKPGFSVLLFCLMLFFQVGSVFGQTYYRPQISYLGSTSFTVTKGISASGIISPTSSGGTVPRSIRGGVQETIPLGNFLAERIMPTNDGHLIAMSFRDNKISKTNLATKLLVKNFSRGTDKPRSFAKDSKGNIYWSEVGGTKIVKNPSKPDETDFLGGLLTLAEELPVVGDAISIFNGVNEIYGNFNGGDDLLRKITGQSNDGAAYRLDFSGKIWVLRPGQSEPEIYLNNVQAPTGIAIDASDNLYIACFTANYDVKGGWVLDGSTPKKEHGESGKYNAKFLRVNTRVANPARHEIGSFDGLDYPSQLGVDGAGNLTVMFNHGKNMELVNIARIRKFQEGKTSGEEYEIAQEILAGGTKLGQNLPIYLDMAVDKEGNLYLSDVYGDKIWMLPHDTNDEANLQIFSEEIISPFGLYIDWTNRQLWVNEGKLINTAAIKKLSLDGFSVTPRLPQGLSLTTTGAITGTSTVVSFRKNYKITASNQAGYAAANFTLESKQIEAPIITYGANNTFDLGIGQAANIPAPTNSGGGFLQKIGPTVIDEIYTGNTTARGFAFDNQGNRYFAQPDLNRIMKVDAAGTASVFLDNLNDPYDIAIDQKSNAIYFIERKAAKLSVLYPGFTQPSLIGTGSFMGLTFDDKGNIYTVNPGVGTIDKFEIQTLMLKPNIAKNMVKPMSITYYDNHLYTLSISGEIHKISLSNNLITKLNQVNNGYEIDIDNFGNLYVATSAAVYKMPYGTTTLAPIPYDAWYFSGLGVDNDNNLYIAPVIYGSKDYKAVKITSGGYSITPSLPTGLTFNGNGTVNGTPNALKPRAEYVVKALNPKGESAAKINIAVVNLPTTSFSNILSTVLYRDVLIKEGKPIIHGGFPESFTVSPALPQGLTLNATSGVVTGTPVNLFTKTQFTFTAINSSGGNKTWVQDIEVKDVAPTAIQYTLANTKLQRDVAIALTPQVSGGKRDLVYAVTPTLPAGLTLNTATGEIKGTPTAITAQKTYVIKATNTGGSVQTNLAFEVVLDPPTNLVYTLATTSILRDEIMMMVSPTYNGAGVRTFSISPILPTGLSFNATTGEVSGKPTVLSSATTYTVTATNDGGTTTSTFSLAVVVQAPTALTYNLPASVLRNEVFAAVLPTYLGSKATSFGIVPSLPAGLSLNTLTGEISGTPTEMSARKEYTVTVTNEAGNTTYKFNLAVRVDAPTQLAYEFASTSLFAGAAITPVTPTYKGSPVANFSIQPTLPTGLSFDSATGRIFGTPTTAVPSAVTYTVTAENDGGSGTAVFSLWVTELKPENLTYTLVSNTLLRDVAINNFNPKYTGGTATNFSIDKTLPGGLTLNATTGVISGTPTVNAAATTYTITASNTKGSTQTTINFSVYVDIPKNLTYTIANSVLKGIGIGTIKPVFECKSPISSFEIAPTLPAGLTFDTQTGAITGTPTAIVASKDYKVTVRNDAGSAIFNFPFAVRVDAPTNLRYDFTTNELQKNVGMLAVVPKFGGSPTNTFAISPNLPAGLNFDSTTGRISGAPSLESPEITYTLTATNEGGSGTYSFPLSVSRISIPELTYPSEVFTFTKDKLISTIAKPINTGAVFPQQFRNESFVAGLTKPSGVAIDGKGIIYIADYVDGKVIIKKFDKATAQLSDFITDGLGTVQAYDLAADINGNIYVSLGNVLKKITPNKTITDFATGLNNAKGLFIDNDNDLYVANYSAGEVLLFENCVASTKTIAVSGLNIPITYLDNARNPLDIVVDRQKNIYVLDAGHILRDNTTKFMHVFRFYAADNYAHATKQLVTNNANALSYYMALDRKGNIYIDTDSRGFLAINILTETRKYFNSSNLLGIIRGMALDADENLYSALAGTANSLSIFKQNGYSSTTLPNGLVLNEDGTITGTPTTVKSVTEYTVSANSFYGVGSAKIKIAIVDEVPNFSYDNADQILTKGVTNLDLTPVKIGGPVSAYVIKPTTLPAGLTFNATTGKITGTATNLQDTISRYTVSATNTGGTGSYNVSIKIIDVAPANLVYPTNHELVIDQQYASTLPTIQGGPVTKWTVSPALPDGLFIDEKTGEIFGHPRVIADLATYTVKTENTGGFVTAQMTLLVKNLPPNISYASNSKHKLKKDVAIAPINAPNNVGGPIVSYTISSGLPSGLTFNTATGEISGTPNQLKSAATYKVTANGGRWGNAEANITLEVISLPPNQISYESPLTIVRGTAIASMRPTFTSTGGDPIERYAITPSLPAGMSINSATGEISGTPNHILQSNGQLFYVIAENGAGKVSTPVVFILKDLPPAISYTATNTFTKGIENTLNVNSTGGAVTNYVISPELPEGLSLNVLTGVISGNPVALMTSTSYTVTASNYGNPEATSTFNLAVVDQVPVISYGATHHLLRTVEISPISVSATGGQVVSYGISPSLPAGLTLNTSTGQISGTPTTSAAQKNYTITATNTGGTATFNLSLSVKNAAPVIAYQSAYTLNRNINIAGIAPVSTGGDQITYAISPSNLPSGLSFNTQTGAITGKPLTVEASRSYTVTATNDGGNTSATFNIIVNETPPGNISYTTVNGDFYVGYPITPLSPNVAEGSGIIEGYSINPTLLAPGLTFNTTTGVLSGTPTSDFIRTSYVITAQNSGGISQTTVTFAVIKLATTLQKTDVLCYGGNTGTATVTVIGGLAPFTYQWSNNPSIEATATGLRAGTYTVTVRDANNTVVTNTVTIGQPEALAITGFTKNDNSVKNGNTGSATATVTGGTAPYTYVWSSNTSITATANALTEGEHTLTVTDANGCSVAKVVFIDAPPAAPLGLRALAGNAKNSINWNLNSEADVASYKIYRGIATNPTTLLQVITSPITTYTDENLTNGTTYYYKVVAVDKGNFESVASAEVSATPQGAQIITFGAIQAKTYGDTDFNVGAVATSGLTVTYSSDNEDVATIINGKIHIVGAGTANIMATQAGNQTWLAANNVTQQLVVNKKTLTITATASAKTYNGLPNASVVLSDNRLFHDELTLNYETAWFNNKNVGATKQVTVGGISVLGAKAVNYSYNTTAVTTADINAKALTITAIATSKIYDANTTATVTLNDDRVTGDVLVASYTTATYNNKNVDVNKPVSIKGITITGTDAANYTVNTTTSTTANITARALVVTAIASNKVYDGNAVASVQLSDNRVAGDVLTSQYGTSTFNNKNVGIDKLITISAIAITGADAANYTANTTTTAQAAIVAKSLTVTATGINKVYDGAFTATVNLSDNRISGDQLTTNYGFAIFDDKNVGTVKGVAVFGINITGADALNYTVNATTNTVAAITPKALIITAENKTKIQGLPLPNFTTTYSGFVAGENSSILTTQPSLSTIATATSSQGTYPIAVNNATAQNYIITHLNGVLTVEPGTPTKLSLAQDLLLENKPENTLVGLLSSVSPDPNAIFTYSLVAGAGDTDNSKFVIVDNKINTSQSFNYESQQSFNVRLKTTNQYGLSLAQTFVIQLTDVNEAPLIDAINNQIICYTSAQQNLTLTGIAPGPELSQSTVVTATSSNNSLFSTLNVGSVNNGSATLNYRVANGQSGTAVITVTVTDNGGTANGGINAVSKTFTVVVNPLPQISITSSLGIKFSKGKTTTLTATGGVSYVWSGDAGLIGDKNSSTIEVRPEKQTSTYTVQVTSAAGCTSIQTISLSTEEDLMMIAGTNVITPNGDGINDNLIIKNVDLYPNNELKVFDRAGRLIYHRNNYQNDWNGTLNGIPLAEDTYYYIIDFKNVGKYKGFISIIKQ